MTYLTTFLVALGLMQQPNSVANTIQLREARFDEIIQLTMEQAEVPGAFAVMTLNGDVVYEKAFGVSDIVTRDPFTSKTPARLASATKVLSSLALISLVEDGDIRLTDNVCDYDKTVPRKWCRFPLWRLANHTSGLPMIVAQPRFHKIPDTEKLTTSGQDLLAIIEGLSMDFQPGEGWHYQQSGLLLLAQLIEGKTGNTWTRTLLHHVLEPAGMQHTRWTQALVDQAPAYDRQDEELISTPAYYPKAMSQGGGYDTTGEDLRRLLMAISTEKIVSHSGYENALLRPGRLHRLGRDVLGEGYGLGSIVQIYGESTTFGHSGGGGLADIRFAHEPNIGVAVVTNRAGGTAAANIIASQLLEEVLGPEARELSKDQ